MAHELIAWYPLNGNLNDYSPYKGKNTINSNSLTYDVNYAANGKRYAKCASGGYAKITVAELVDKLEFSYSLWVYTSKTIDGDWKQIFRINDGGSNCRLEACKSSSYKYSVNNNTSNKTYTGTPGKLVSSTMDGVYEKWHHIVFTRSTTACKLYVDGVWDGSTATSTENTVLGSFEIYADHYSSVSDVRIYNYPLSQKEVNDLYKAPVALYTFEGFTLAGSNNVNLYTGSNADGVGGASAFTRSSGNGCYNYKASATTAPTSDGWPNIYFPYYSFTAGATYTVSLDIRVNKWTCSNTNFTLTMRHARRGNDYNSPKMVAVATNKLADGKWRRYSLTLQLDATHANGSNTATTNPRIELYTGSYKGLTYDLDFDMKNVMVTKTSVPVPYNNGTSTITYIPDNSGNLNNMTPSNISIIENSSYESGGKSLGVFNNSYISCASIFSKMMISEGFTYALDFEINNMTTAGLLIDRAVTGNTFAIFILGSGMRIDTSAGQHAVSGVSLTTGTLYHFMFVNDGSTNYVYMNGELKDKWTGKIDAHGTITSIGASQANGSGYGNYLNGHIANAEIYATPFTAAMITEYYKTKIRVSDAYDFHGYNIIEDAGNNNSVSMDYMMNGNFSGITEDNATSAMKFYDDASMKTHGLYADSATLEKTTVDGNCMALSLNLNNCCNKSLYDGGVSIISYSYDNNLYTESDGSTWVRIFHHSNPASAVFSSSDDYASGKVYKDADRWFAVGACSLASSWELMIKQKLTSTSSEVKYRWTQPKNPMICSYADIHGNVVHNTTSGYTSYTYGGLFKKNSSAYIVCDNNTSGGNWFGAIGSWTSYGGGIPAYPSGAVTTGYIDLYIRVTIPGNDSSVFTSKDAVRYIDSYISSVLTK